MKFEERAACKILGIEVTPSTLDALLQRIEESIATRSRLVIAGHNLHSSFLYHTDREFRSFYELADVILADGAPVLWDLRVSNIRERSERIGSTDWIPHLDRITAIERVLVVGASAKANLKFVQHLASLMVSAEIRGFPGEEWNDSLAREAQRRLEEFQPQLLLIGLGMPLQEKFLLEIGVANSDWVSAPVGGAIDQLVGAQRNAPRWLGRFGLEWLWRLVQQPKRLWRRYLIEPWKLLGIRLRQRFTKEWK